jgi:hypothetical protein
LLTLFAAPFLESESSAFTAFPRFWLFGWWCLFVFFFDFFYAFVNVFFELVADVVVVFAECVCTGGDGEFACDDSGDFSTLPTFSVVEELVLED